MYKAMKHLVMSTKQPNFAEIKCPKSRKLKQNDNRQFLYTTKDNSRPMRYRVRGTSRHRSEEVGGNKFQIRY